MSNKRKKENQSLSISTSLVLNFTGFIFTVLIANMKKDIQFCDSSILNLILLFNCLKFLNYQHKPERAKNINVISQQKILVRMELTSETMQLMGSDVSLCVKTYKLFSTLCRFYLFCFLCVTSRDSCYPIGC